MDAISAQVAIHAMLDVIWPLLPQTTLDALTYV